MAWLSRARASARCAGFFGNSASTLPDLVLIGGCVPFLYRRYGGFREWRGGESLTREVDILTGEELPTRGRQTIAKRLDEVGAISLAGLEFLREHSRDLTVPAEEAGGKEASLEVRVPLLGAFAVHKAVTFAQRAAATADAGESKRAKDLLYLRDLIAGGAEVTARIDERIAQFKAEAGTTRDLVGKAANNLRLLQSGQWVTPVREAARMLVERGDVTGDDGGLADIRGHIDDFVEVLIGEDPD